MKCTQCNNTEVIPNIRVLDRVSDGGKSDLALETHISPHALFVNDTVSIPLTANVCGKCGTVMFSINEPKHLDLLRQSADGYEEVGDSNEEDLNSSPGFGSFLEEKGSKEEDSKEENAKDEGSKEEGE